MRRRLFRTKCGLRAPRFFAPTNLSAKSFIVLDFWLKLPN